MAQQSRPRALVIASLGISQILAWASSYYLPAVLARPMAEATGWPLATIVGSVSAGLLVSGLASPLVGRLIERHGGRPVLAASAVLLAAGLGLLASAPNVAWCVVAWLVLGLGMAAGLYDAAFATLGRLYGLAARGAITSLTLWGGFASTLGWPLAAWLIDQLGWRGACLAFAGLQLLVVLPLHLCCLPGEARRLPPAVPAALPAGQGPGRRSAGLVLGLLAVIVMTGGAISASWSVHLINLLTASGSGVASAVALGALVGPSQVGARLVESAFGRSYHPIWTLAAAGLLIALGLALLWAELPLPALALICYGAGNGIWSIARGTVPLALFGADGYASLMGRLALPSLLAQSLAPWLGAVLLERTGAAGLLSVLALLGLLNLSTIIALWLIVRPHQAAH